MAPHATLELSYTLDSNSTSTSTYTQTLPISKLAKSWTTTLPEKIVLNTKSSLEIDRGSQRYERFFLRLTVEEVEDIKRAADYFQQLHLPFYAINASTFPLAEELSSKLRGALDIIYGQQKFLIICGLNSFDYDEAQNVIIHAGLSSHVGNKRGMPGREGGNNTVLNHITQLPIVLNGSVEQYHGPPNQSIDIPFHTDNGDIVSLYTVSRSHRGGSFYLADSASVYSDLLAFKPELAQTLRDDWTLVSPSPSKAYDTRPIAYHDQESGRILMNCSRVRITGTPADPRPASLPALTERQQEALDALQKFATKRAVEIQLQAGDLVLFNNLAMLHARNAFVDKEDEGHKRHLMRLILRNEAVAYELSSALSETWKALYEHEVEEEELPVKKELFTFATSH